MPVLVTDSPGNKGTANTTAESAGDTRMIRVITRQSRPSLQGALNPDKRRQRARFQLGCALLLFGLVYAAKLQLIVNFAVFL
jgi:hypothetical protein